MKLRKTIDEKFAEIGFRKVNEGHLYVEYERFNADYQYMQKIALFHKSNGYHLIQSYVKDVNSEGFNNVVGLTMYEADLCLKKMKSKKWKIKYKENNK